MPTNTGNYLDNYLEAYDDTFPYALDNRLILNWYPNRILRKRAGGSLLELGIGHGYSSAVFTPHFSRHTIIEGSKEIIDSFQQRHPSSSIEIAHAFFEDFTPDATYDVIVMGFVLEHVEDPAAVVSRYAHFLADGGSFYITVPNAMALHRRIGHAAGLLADYFSLSDADKALGHRRTFSLETLRSLVENNGLHVTYTEGLLLKPFTTMQVQSLNLSEDIYQALLSVGIEYPELSVALMVEAKAAP